MQGSGEKAICTICFDHYFVGGGHDGERELLICRFGSRSVWRTVGSPQRQFRAKEPDIVIAPDAWQTPPCKSVFPKLLLKSDGANPIWDLKRAASRLVREETNVEVIPEDTHAYVSKKRGTAE